MFIQILQEYFESNSGDPDRTPLSVAVSGLDLHCSSLSPKRHWSYVLQKPTRTKAHWTKAH